MIGEVDLYLLSEGRHERLWEVLGAHVTTGGTTVSVWAPNAWAVQVPCDANGWNGGQAPLSPVGGGVWSGLVPGLGEGHRYKIAVQGADGRWVEHADPMARRTEVPPATASVVDVSNYTWNDAAWLERRAAGPWIERPISIYEVHLGSWRPGLSYRELATELVAYVRESGFTHVELLPVAEHPFGGSWGYQVTSYYAPTARFGGPDDFRYLVDALHGAGIGVIVDWVPAHFPRDEWALARFDGTALYEHADPRRGEQLDWGTLVFDFGRHEVRNFLVANALYWIEEFHLDGLRVDAVASMLYLDYSRTEWLPNAHGGREHLEAVALLAELNGTVGKHHPDVMMIAEESTAWPGVTAPTSAGGLGFGLKWNMGWMHDTLQYTSRERVHRQYHQHEITHPIDWAWSENFVLPLSHDEVVHGKRSLWGRQPGDPWNKAAGLRALLAYMWAHPGKKLLFMGGEFGQTEEWSEGRGLDWHELDDPLHAGVARLVADLNRTYAATPALFTLDHRPEGFDWVDASDTAGNVVAFRRIGSDGGELVCVANFSGTPHHDYRLGLPRAGTWREVLNTDAQAYGGSGVGNLGTVRAEPVGVHGQPASAVLQLPPGGVLWLVPA